MTVLFKKRIGPTTVFVFLENGDLTIKAWHDDGRVFVEPLDRSELREMLRA